MKVLKLRREVKLSSNCLLALKKVLRCAVTGLTKPCFNVFRLNRISKDSRIFVLIREQLSKSNQDLVYSFGKLHRDGTLYRTNYPLTLPYIVDEKYGMSDEARQKLSKEIRDVVLKHLQSARSSFMPKLGNVKLGRSQNVVLGINLFRKSVAEGIKMASCKSFLCLGYVQDEQLKLESIPRGCDEGSVRSVECPKRQFDLLSSEDGVLVKTEDNQCQIYESVDGEPVTQECSNAVMGFAKFGEKFVTLNSVNNSMRWMPSGVIPQINSSSKMYRPLKCANIAKVDTQNYTAAVCLWETTCSTIYPSMLAGISYWRTKEKFNNGSYIGYIVYSGMSQNNESFV